MAKLRAHGQELARMVREQVVTDSDSVVWRRRTVCLMSDGRIMSKDDARFKAGPYDQGKDQLYSWGWKRGNKVKQGIGPAEFIAAYVKAGYVEA